MHEPRPSTIEQMQKLYQSEHKEQGRAPSLTGIFDFGQNQNNTAESINESSDENELNELLEDIVEEIEESKKEEKYQGVFFSPRKLASLDEQPTSRNHIIPNRKTEKELTKPSAMSLFSKVVNSVGLGNVKVREEETVYILDEDKQVDEEEMITDEMLNIPAYQRRK